ncbi:hypothetical protein NP233_g4096 [Leucocoprinus birnbaumii]|uniref:Uncharacterized protein n=1 Tax=Leucocoprinus birnbaumii TaxID=56174 RepID=A0AAD5YVU8_9AGAR|nr:hypothetical protein NP233_g4096 [Leucocoprinus birnbaumii]
MSKDTGDNPPSKSPKYSKKYRTLHSLTRYVQAKAEKEPNDVIVDYPEIENACRLFLSKIILIEEKEPNEIPKNAFANFLDVLSHAESFRLKIIEQADIALNTWNTFFMKEDPTQALSPDEAASLDTIIQSKDEWRTVYMKILKKTIALACLLPSILYFMVRLLEYNPHMFKPTNGLEPCPRNFMQLLSTQEIKQIKDTSKKSLQLVKESYEWLEINFADDILTGLYSEDFQKAHPPPTDLERLQSLLHYYLKHISDIHQTLTKFFPPQPNQKSPS